MPHGDLPVTIAAIVFTATLVCVLVGFRTRSSLTVAALLGWYVLGLPQTFGKVDHDHHLLWCLIVLAAVLVGTRSRSTQAGRALASTTVRTPSPDAVDRRGSRVLLPGLLEAHPGRGQLGVVGQSPQHHVERMVEPRWLHAAGGHQRVAVGVATRRLRHPAVRGGIRLRRLHPLAAAGSRQRHRCSTSGPTQ